MRKSLSLFLSLLLFVMPGQLEARQRKALFVILDGIPADCIWRLQPPTIMSIAREGHLGRAFCGGERNMYNQTPTISAVGYTNILTGTWVNKHNVWDNSNIKINYNYWNIFRIAENQHRPVTTALFSSWTDNRTILLGAGKPEAGNLKIDYVFDGYDLDKARFPKKPDELQVLDNDIQVAADAAKCIGNDAPDLSWLYLWYSDDAFHLHGYGAFADRYVMKADSLLSQVWKAVKMREKKYKEDWLVIVTTDHGRAVTGFGHGGQTDNERNIWMATNIKKVNRHFFSPTLSHVDILPTICRWMNFEIPRNVGFELDGQPFYGRCHMADLFARKYDDKVILYWNYLGRRSGDVRRLAPVYVATTNNFATGGEDKWQIVGWADEQTGQYSVDLCKLPKSSFYKFSVGGLSRWWKP